MSKYTWLVALCAFVLGLLLGPIAHAIMQAIVKLFGSKPVF